MIRIPNRTTAARLLPAWWALLVVSVLLGGAGAELFARHDHGSLDADHHHHHHHCPACLAIESPAEPPAECASIGAPSPAADRALGIPCVAAPQADPRPAAYLLRGPPPALLIG